MANYYRITAYHKQHDVSAILDSFGCFKEIWQFSSYLVKKGFTIIAVGDTARFTEGNLTRIKPDNEHIVMRACKRGQPVLNGMQITINNKTYSKINNSRY